LLLRGWTTLTRRVSLPAVVIIALSIGGFVNAAMAQVSITSLGTPVLENFNTLASTGTSSSVPVGWAFLETLTNANTTYTAGTGSSNVGDTYSFGSSGSPERAFGQLRSGNLASVLGAQIKNNTGGPIHQLQIDYTGEQWRFGGTTTPPDRLDFQYSTDATSLSTGTWTDVDALDFSSPIVSGTVGALDGNAAANRRAIAFKFPVTVAAGATVWIRWTDFDPSGSDDGLAIDDVAITASQITTTVLTVSPSKTFVGDKVTMVAHVSPTPPAGKAVTFTDGAVILGTSPVDASGNATFSISTLAAGTHSLIAVYPGNPGTKPSTSNKVTHEVNPSPTSDLTLLSACATDSLKNCTHVVFTNQPWHILFTVRNTGQKVVDHWSYDITLHGSLGSTPIKTQVDGPPLAVGSTSTINWPSPYIFASDQKGDWAIEVVAKIKDATNPDANPNDNRFVAQFTVSNKPTPPPSDIAVDFVCAADSTKSCSNVIYTNQPWHILFTVRNTGQKPVDNWSFDIGLEGTVDQVLKSQVSGGPLAVGSSQTINWPSPRIFGTSDKGTWRVSVSTKIKDPTNPDADPTNNSASATFTVANKGGGQVSDLAVQSVCATDSTKQCSHVVYTNQPWHVLFAVANLGNKVIDNWSYDILAYSDNGTVLPLKTQVPGPPIFPGTPPMSINWSSPTVLGSDQKGHLQIIVQVKVKDPTNPDPNPTNDTLSTTVSVLNKTTNPVSDLAVTLACATDSSKQCSSVVYTNQPWHVLFSVANLGNMVIDNWSFDIALYGAGGILIPLKTQVPGPPIYPGAPPLSINWSSPTVFTSAEKGNHEVLVTVKVKDPTNPDPNPGNDQGHAFFTVLNKGGGQPSDIAISSACVTLAGAGGAPQGPGQCTPFFDVASFRAYNQGTGKVPKGIETFEEAVIQPQGKNCFPSPLGPAPNPPSFPNGLDQRNLFIQENMTPTPDPPVPNPSTKQCALFVVGPGFLGANSKKVGEDIFLQNQKASIDLLFSEPNHTGIGFKLSRFPGYPGGGWHITVYNKADQIIGTFEVPGDSVNTEPDKTFFGVWCQETIGRINIFDRAAAPSPEAIDDIEMWTEPVVGKVCTDTLYTHQPWHVDFNVKNAGQKPIDNWSFDIDLYGPQPGQVIPIKTQVAGPPLPVGGVLSLNWESPYIFASDQKGPWRVVVTVKIKDASNPDSDPTNNSAGAGFVVLNKPTGETTDIAVQGMCATDSTKQCSSIVYTNQPWHTLFRVANLGNKVADNWSFDILLQGPLGTPPIPLKTQVPGPPIQPGTAVAINWPSPHIFGSTEKGTWTVIVSVKVKDPTNPDADPTNDQAAFTFNVVNKAPQVSDLAIPFACATDSAKQCTHLVYTNQPWHVLFAAANLGNKVIDNWSYDILLQGPGGVVVPLKTQVQGPPLQPGPAPVTINWPSPHLFQTSEKGPWQVIVRAEVKDPTNPDPNNNNNTASATFEVVNKPVLVTNIAIPSVCVADSTDSCRTFLFTYEAWNAIFDVLNRGLKIADAWAFDLDLYKVGTPQHIIVKTQVGGPPLPVGAGTTIHWPGPIFVAGDEGDWDIVATAKVKDPTNPDSDPSDNTATARFRVRSPVTATQLSLFEASPAEGGLRLRWQFVDPVQVASVDAQRAPAATGPWSTIGADRHDESGITALVDRGVSPGVTYWYRLVARMRDGESQTFGPVMASLKGAVTAFALTKIAPNPSFGSTRIEFAVPRESNIRLSVMDLQGREVAVLADGPAHPGVFQVTWNGRTFRGDAPAGLYFVHLRTPQGVIVKRLALTK
jgi:hypothetical protein